MSQIKLGGVALLVIGLAMGLFYWTHVHAQSLDQKILTTESVLSLLPPAEFESKQVSWIRTDAEKAALAKSPTQSLVAVEDGDWIKLLMSATTINKNGIVWSQTADGNIRIKLPEIIISQELLKAIGIIVQDEGVAITYSSDSKFQSGEESFLDAGMIIGRFLGSPYLKLVPVEEGGVK